MKQEQINEMWALLEKHAQEKNYKISQVLAFLSTCLVGTMAMHGYTEEFFDATCERMKVNFRKKKKDGIPNP